MGDDRVRSVCFTGSPAGGRQIVAMAAGTLTRVTLELGDDDAALLLDDVDLGPEAVQRLVSGTFDTTGQVCMAVQRLSVHRSRYDEVVDTLSGVLGRTRIGHGPAEGVTMGPLHQAGQRAYVEGLPDQARHSGAEVRELGGPAGDTGFPA